MVKLSSTYTLDISVRPNDSLAFSPLPRLSDYSTNGAILVNWRGGALTCGGKDGSVNYTNECWFLEVLEIKKKEKSKSAPMKEFFSLVPHPQFF